MPTVPELLRRRGVNRTAKTTARRHAPSDSLKGGALNDVAVKKRDVASTSDDCSDGFRSAPSGICQLCSAPTSPYEEEICGCTAYGNAVLGCKREYDGNPLCPPRAAALKECTARGFTSSTAPRTTSSAGSIAASSVASVVHAAFTGDAAHPRSTTSTSTQVIGMDTTSSSDGTTFLALGVSIGMTAVVIGVIIGVIIARHNIIRQRRKAVRHEQRIMHRDDPFEAKESKDKLIHADLSCEPSCNGVTPLGSQMPSSVVHNYHVTVKNSQFTQVGSNNVMSVGEQLAAAIPSADELESEDEEQVFYTGGLDASGGTSLSRCTSRDATFSRLLNDQPELVLHQPVQGDTTEMRSGVLASRSLSAGRLGEEQHNSALANSGPVDTCTTPHRNSASGLLQRHEELSGSRHRDDESATADSSHLPTEITDFSSQLMAAPAKSLPASLPAACTHSSIVTEPLFSLPCDKEFRAPSVSGQSADIAALPFAQTSSSLFNSRHPSVDGRGENESLPMHPAALLSLNAGTPAMLDSLSQLPTGEVTQNSDYDPALPTPSTATFQPLSVIREWPRLCQLSGQ